MEDFYRQRNYDWSIAQQQPYLKVYALKSPIFYQDSSVGGQEAATKFKFKTEEENMKELLSWKNTDNFSIKTVV